MTAFYRLNMRVPLYPLILATCVDALRQFGEITRIS
jgi:hypothetical protein